MVVRTQDGTILNTDNMLRIFKMPVPNAAEPFATTGIPVYVRISYLGADPNVFDLAKVATEGAADELMENIFDALISEESFMDIRDMVPVTE